jgi:IclR family acetate operon transcriptional repressor
LRLFLEKYTAMWKTMAYQRSSRNIKNNPAIRKKRGGGAFVLSSARNTGGPMTDAVTPLRRRGRPASAGSETSGEVQSLDRAIALLEVLAGGEGLGLSEIARQAELPPSTVHRLLMTLHRRRLVSHDTETGLWTVGVGLFRIGSAYLRIRKLPEIARPVIRQLLQEVGETVNVSMLDQREIVCVAQAESHAAVRAFFRLGRRLPIHASAAGKAILAAGTESFRDELLEGVTLERFTDKTHRSRKALLADLVEIAARGWAFDDEEHTVGMQCVSAAILNEWSEPAGAISISAPAVRMGPQRAVELGRRVKETARVLSELYSGLKLD